MLALSAALGVVAGWVAATGKTKAQAVRALDVLVLGPGLVAAAATIRLPPFARYAVAFAGGATVSYNARNFLAERGSDGSRGIS